MLPSSGKKEVIFSGIQQMGLLYLFFWVCFFLLPGRTAVHFDNSPSNCNLKPTRAAYHLAALVE
jgi:hypothetical protein